jgi:membrane protease subunit (stomatin/prohibitin family)
MVFNFLSGQFIDVIHWTDDTRDTMVWRFEREGHEIKYGAKLTVREGQAAVFVHEGQLADVFTPGLYMLETNNMPILTTLQHWDHGFKSPFKSEIYFVNTTASPISNGAPRTRSCCATRNSGRPASAPSAPIP